jgi:type IV pilus assembly protein PilW
MSPSNFMRAKKTRPMHRSKGLTLVELLVSLLLGIFLLGGIVSVYVSSQQNFGSNEGLAQIQDNMRFTFEQMGRDIREAGSNPCGTQRISTVLRSDKPINTVVPYWADWTRGTVRGFAGNVALPNGDIPFGNSVNDRVTGTDAILVLRTDLNESSFRRISSVNSVTKEILLNAAVGNTIRRNDLLLACDAVSGAIFQADNVAAPNTAAPRVSYDATADNNNCTNSLVYPPVPIATPCTGTAQKDFKTTSTTAYLTPFESAVWYVGVNSRGTRSLFRAAFDNISTTNSTITATRSEIVPNIQSMTITYQLFDRNAPTATNAIDPTWRDASDPLLNPLPTDPTAPNGGWGLVDRYQVVAVRVELTFVSQNPNLGVNTDGTQVQAIQRSSRAVFTLRNRDQKVPL